MAAGAIFFHLLILLSIFTTSCRSQQVDRVRCMYSMYVSTGTMLKAGTNSTISLDLLDATGYGITIADLVRLGGFMTKDQHDYFEPGNIDLFSLSGPCLTGPLCAIKITSDGSGPDDEDAGDALAQGWYCKYLEITTMGFGKPSFNRTFTVEGWLAPHPYRLSTVRNYCNPSGRESHTLPSKLSNLVTV